MKLLILLSLISMGCQSMSSDVKGRKQKKTVQKKVVKDPYDPFRPFGADALIQNKKSDHYLEPLNIDWRRTGQRVQSQDLVTTYFPKAKDQEHFTNHIYLANVKHLRYFYIAEIPIDGIERVKLNLYQFAYQFNYFHLNHVGLRFLMKDGYKIRYKLQYSPEGIKKFLNAEYPNLKPNDYDVFKGPVPQDERKDLLEFERTSIGFATYAFGRQGTLFNRKNSKKSRMVSAMMFFTPDHLNGIFERDVVEKNMQEINIDLTPRESQRVFYTAVSNAQMMKQGATYGMFTRNCIHDGMRTLYEGKNYKPVKVKKGILSRVISRILVGPSASKYVFEKTKYDGYGGLSGLTNLFIGNVTQELIDLEMIKPEDKDSWHHAHMDPELRRLLNSDRHKKYAKYLK